MSEDDEKNVNVSNNIIGRLEKEEEFNTEYGMNRAKMPNPYNYTKLQLALKEKTLLDMCNQYNNLPQKWVEWVYDYIHNGETSIKEVREIINSGLWEKKSWKTDDKGGVLDGEEHMKVIPNDKPIKEYLEELDAKREQEKELKESQKIIV